MSTQLKQVFFGAIAIWGLAVGALGGDFSVIEATIPEMQGALRDGRTTSQDLVTQYLIRIAQYENILNATVTVNPMALLEARRLDQERNAGKVRGPLHGIPIALKDNIHTTDMTTTGGTLAFATLVPPYDATVTKNLREAGAIIIAKTVMTELANGMTNGMPANYSSIAGYSFNPYDPRKEVRKGRNDGRPVLSTGGSSSGVGTAANLWAANVGTDTTGSILGPSNANMLAAVKPTVGRTSRYGVIPLTSDMDTVGPMARTVTDAAILLGILEGASPDPNDPATKRCEPPSNRDYTQFLRADGLRGARIGVPRAWYIEEHKVPSNGDPSGGLPEDQKAMMNDVIAILKSNGATIVDPADIPSVITTDTESNILMIRSCSGDRKAWDATCSIMMRYGMKRDFNAWLASLGEAAPVMSLTELREWNTAHSSAGTLKYGQTDLDANDELDLERDKLRYESDRARERRLSAFEGVDATLTKYKLDALIFASERGAGLIAKPGYPGVIVPFGMVANGSGYPEDFKAEPMPTGPTFAGTACSEPRLLELAYAFEQATKRRQPPVELPKIQQ